MKFFTTFFLVLLTGNLLFSQNPNRIGKDYAYLFYVSDFRNSVWNDLPETKEEAEILAKELTTNFGFQVELIGNASKEEIENKMLEINSKKYSDKDQVLLFFSTHGYYNQTTDRGFLIPVDGKSSKEDPLSKSWLSYDDLGYYATMNPCSHLLVALDACYSGAFGDRWKGVPKGLPWDEEDDCIKQQKNSLSFEGRFYFTSGSKYERTPSNSKFVKRWLNTLRSSKEMISTSDLRLEFNSIESPKPEGGTFSSKHQPGSDFLFLKKNACVSEMSNNKEAEDNADWKNVEAEMSQEKLLNHFQQFPGCSHEQIILSLLKKDAVELEPEDGAVKVNERRLNTEMVFVSGGTFTMGSNKGDKDEKPPHQVSVESFYIDKYEVTNSQYATFLNQIGKYRSLWINLKGSYENEKCRIIKKGKKYLVEQGYENYPVLFVSWYGAMEYAKFYNLRLPTEAEWEFAAREGNKNEGFIFSGSDTPSKVAWFTKNTKNNGTKKVGLKNPNALGIYDMSGNVWEWCLDGKRKYKSKPEKAPMGSKPSSNTEAVFRGGSYHVEDTHCRVTNRGGSLPMHHYEYIGFRCVESK